VRIARAIPVSGPLEVIEQGVTGVLHPNLAEAITSALRLDRSVCAQGFDWEAATRQLLAGLAPIARSLRAKLAVSRSSVIIARMAARRQASGAGDAN
jgi:hypothetical protein